MRCEPRVGPALARELGRDAEREGRTGREMHRSFPRHRPPWRGKTMSNQCHLAGGHELGASEFMDATKAEGIVLSQRQHNYVEVGRDGEIISDCKLGKRYSWPITDPRLVQQSVRVASAADERMVK